MLEKRKMCDRQPRQREDRQSVNLKIGTHCADADHERRDHQRLGQRFFPVPTRPADSNQNQWQRDEPVALHHGAGEVRRYPRQPRNSAGKIGRRRNDEVQEVGGKFFGWPQWLMQHAEGEEVVEVRAHDHGGDGKCGAHLEEQFQKALSYLPG